MLKKIAAVFSHIFIRNGDTNKREMVDFSIRHFKKNNPGVYIILTGHGQKPLESTCSICDYVFWSDKILEKEIGAGHPHLVGLGIDHAINSGFEYILKMRADGILLLDNIAQHCLEVLLKEK